MVLELHVFTHVTFAAWAIHIVKYTYAYFFPYVSFVSRKVYCLENYLTWNANSVWPNTPSKYNKKVFHRHLGMFTRISSDTKKSAAPKVQRNDKFALNSCESFYGRIFINHFFWPDSVSWVANIIYVFYNITVATLFCFLKNFHEKTTAFWFVLVMVAAFNDHQNKKIT